MALSDDVRRAVEHAIQEHIGIAAVRSVRVESIEVSDDRGEIRIVLLIETEVEPRELARKFMGLTGRVRGALGETWRDFFPVITPVVGREAHV